MVDQPLQIAKDRETKREYLLCDYNRDADSYRSPWSNTYDPPIADASYPSESLRKLEIEANATFQAYCDLYFEGGLSSVYFWDMDSGFGAVILIKKQAEGLSVKGCWDSIHIIECKVSFEIVFSQLIV
jgi:capping protein beta